MSGMARAPSLYMHARWHILTQILAVSALLAGGCFSSKSNRCDARKTCFAADALGCCDGSSVEVSACDACPSGMIERSECRVAGCDDPCEIPLNCVQDLGESCCGAPVFSESCDTCPMGSRPATSCGGFVPECGCFETTLIPPEDDGADREAPRRSDVDCYVDLGEGCCGNLAGTEGECGCAVGTVPQYECANFAVEGDADFFPVEVCRLNFGEGCCGDIVERNACSGECPAGSVVESACDRFRPGSDARPAEPPMDEPADPPADAGVPDAGADDAGAPIRAVCYEVDADGCCGAEVEIDFCTGECPPGSTMDCAFGGGCGA